MRDQQKIEKLSDQNCPVPLSEYPNILMAHGGGGRLMHQLIEEIFVASFGAPAIKDRMDGAIFASQGKRMAFTTDSYVVRPLFFPGGDIGSLAVNGTVNDLTMCGARPLYLSAGFILEEGLSMDVLWRIAQSMKLSAEKAEVKIVTGDTKVIGRQNGDEIFINTAGIGVVEHDYDLCPSAIHEGDAILINGDIGRHGIAIMASREGLSFESTIESDCDDLSGLVGELLSNKIEIRCMRDLTRGGLGVVLNEIAESIKYEIALKESAIPVIDEVRGACEILGLDPIFVANEGRFALFVSQKDAGQALDIMRSHPLGKEAMRIGKVKARKHGMVSLETELGTARIVDMPSGEQLPRIC